MTAAGGLTAAATTPNPARADTRPVVVELFTSQGCSSCPPADAVLAELATRKDVIALGFHVDYWDRLGWKDPLSAPGSTERQNDYAAQFGHKEVYTPQLVVDGQRQAVGSRKAEVLETIAAARPDSATEVSFAPDHRSVTIGAGQGTGRVTLAAFVRNRMTEIHRGENTGRTARDVNGVVQLADLGQWSGGVETFPIDPPDADHGVAVLVQARDGHILGAAALQANAE
jgi:hypothetical protein